MTAFDLNRELKRLSRIENEFKQEYEQLAQQCQDYSAALLAETRSSKELEIILNYDADNPPVLSESNEKMHLSRLKLAIRYKQKKVEFFLFFRSLTTFSFLVRFSFPLSTIISITLVRRFTRFSSSTFGFEDSHNNTRWTSISRSFNRLFIDATK